MNDLRFCACPDHLGMGLPLSRWPDADFPWTITALVPGIGEAEYRTACEWGVSQWAKICGLRPRYVSASRSARLLIGSRSIDGPAGILGETELPAPGMAQVRMWIDTGETWTTSFTPSQRQLILPVVLWHEAGHAIGLGHAPQGSTNIMAPIYNPAVTAAGPWDRAEAVRRYDEPAIPPAPVPPPTPQPQPKPPEIPNMDRAELQKRLDGLLSMARVLASITPTPTDDAIVASLTSLAGQEWFIDFLMLALKRFGGRVSSPTAADVMAALYEFQTGAGA